MHSESGRLVAYRVGGLEGLEPRRRPRTESAVVLSPKLLAFLAAETERDPRANVCRSY